MDTHQETEYVLGNSHLMQQIEQFKHNSQKSHPNKPIHSIDFDYILNPHSADIKADLININLDNIKPETINWQSFQAFFLVK